MIFLSLSGGFGAGAKVRTVDNPLRQSGTVRRVEFPGLNKKIKIRIKSSNI
jgi:hypothetical protein